MNGLLYHLVHNLLAKDKLVWADFSIPGVTGLNGHVIRMVPGRDSGSYTIYSIADDGQTDFMTIYQSELDKLHLVKTPASDGLGERFVIKNVSKDELPVELEESYSEADEPLIITLLKVRMARKEPIFIELGALRYYLDNIEEKVDPIMHGRHWNLHFNEMPKPSLTTTRRIYPDDDKWNLEKIEKAPGDIRWKLEQV